jgi:nucleoside-diphosphate-sugar epimerase
MGAKKKVAIIGLGWLGKQLYELLNKGTYDLIGTNRSGSGVSIVPYDLEDEEVPNDIISADYAVITIPPLRDLNYDKYGHLLRNLVSALNSKCRVLFTSSTGIFPLAPGDYDEKYVFDDNEMSELISAERELQSVLEGRLTILRLGGLIGLDRHPIKYLAGRQIEKNGNDQIALIDGRDVCQIIQEIIDKNIWGEIYNVTYPSDLRKQQYYSRIAHNLQLNPPMFKLISDEVRRINNEKALKQFGHLMNHNILKVSQPLKN